MSDIEKLILFKAETSKADLINNKNFISVLDNNVLSSKAKYTIDSGHMLYITLDVDLLGNLVNNIPEHGVIKTYAQNKSDYWNIVNIDKNLDTVELTCRHWCTETMLSMFIVDSKPRNLNGLAMLDWLKTNSEQYKQGKQFALDLEVGSNLSELKSMNAWHDNFYNIISDLQELYGCEIKKEGFKVELVDHVGSKTPKYKIEYGKNLISNESQEDFNITIGILAKGYDKLYADNIIYSGKLKDNPNMRGQIVEKEYPVRVREEGKEDEDGYIYFDTEEEAKDELERLARLEFTENHIDEPLITFDTEFLELSTVEEHKNDAKVWISIGDKVATYIPKFNIDIETRIIEMEVDMLTGEITSITLSNNDIKDLKPPTLNSIKQEITKLPTAEDVLITAKNESINTVMQGFGGYAHYHPNYTAWTDSKDIKQARQGLLANKNGWFFFRNGLNIETGEADDVTMIADINGNFSADVINVGTLNANLIKTGVLSNVNNTVQLDLQSDEGLLFRNNNKNSIRIRNQTISLYDWDGNGIVGNIYTTRANNEIDRLGVVLAHERNTTTSLSYKHSNGNTYPYIKFDNDNIGDDTQTPITIFKETDFEGTQFWFKYGLNSLYTVDSGAFMANVSKSFNIADRTSNKIVFNMSNKNFAFYEDGNAYLFKQANSNDVWCMYNFKVDKNFHVNGNFTVSGTKNCIQETENYGERLFYSVEDCENYLTDRSMEVFNVEVTSSGTFERLILLDDIFKEAVNLDIDYTVEVIKQGWGDYRIKEQTKDYFIVESDRKDFTFKYVITAKRRGFEKKRLEEYKE